MQQNLHIIRVWGVYLSKTSVNVYKNNFPTLIKNIHEDIAVWQNLKIPFFGNIHVVKANILSEITFS